MRNILTLWLLLASILSNATDYKVSSATELQATLQKVKPGDVVIWKNGTYTDIKLDFSPNQNGREDARIYLKAETPGKVIFKGASQLFIGGNYLQAEGFLFEGISSLTEREDVIAFRSDAKKSRLANYSRVTNCAVIDYSPVDHNVNIDWIILYGTHNEVDHCSFSGKLNQGPYLVVAYDKPKGYIDGSDQSPSTYHSIHHNYFGKRNMPTDNGGECMRIGDSKTSFTKGFNVIQYNYFEGEENEPEVISNKSCDNIYRFNTFYNNDGALVLRHGNRCVVYGNYINGKSGRGYSGGIRIIGEDHTVFNNYLENQEGAKENLKAPITIMGGIPSSPLNGYFAAHRAVVAFNTIVNANGPIFRVGAYAKTMAPVAPTNIILAQNLIVSPQGDAQLLESEKGVSFAALTANVYVSAGRAVTGFILANQKDLINKNGFWYTKSISDKKTLEIIKQRLVAFNIKLTDDEMVMFNPNWIVRKENVGAHWYRL